MTVVAAGVTPSLSRPARARRGDGAGTAKTVSVRVPHFHKSHADAGGNRYKFTKRQPEDCRRCPKMQETAGTGDDNNRSRCK